MSTPPRIFAVNPSALFRRDPLTAFAMDGAHEVRLDDNVQAPAFGIPPAVARALSDRHAVTETDGAGAEVFSVVLVSALFAVGHCLAPRPLRRAASPWMGHAGFIVTTGASCTPNNGFCRCSQVQPGFARPRPLQHGQTAGSGLFS